MAMGLSELAIELVELISNFLEQADLRALRHVCQDLNKKTLNSFGAAHFTTLQTDLSSQSLYRVQSIAELEHFARHVQCLKIDYEHRPGQILGEGFHWPREPSGCLADGSECATTLQKILSQQLSKCRSFIVMAYDEYEPVPNTERLGPGDAVGLLLSVFARANIAVHSLVINAEGGRLHTPNLQMQLWQKPNFISACTTVVELVLDYGITLDQEEEVFNLISLADRLRKLSLNFYEAEASFIRRCSTLQNLGRIEDLTLCSARATESDMIAFLSQTQPSLRSLTIRFCRLDDGGNWRLVFGQLSRDFPQLQSLIFFWLRQGPDNDRVDFPTFLDFPGVAGSETLGANQRVVQDRRQILSPDVTIGLRYWGAKRKVVGLECEGAAVESVMTILANDDPAVNVHGLTDRLGYGLSV